MPCAEALVLSVIEGVNQMLPPEQQLTATPDQPLLGSGGALDSLGLVTLISAIEERAAEEVGVGVSLMDAEALEREPSPYQTLRTLIDYLAEMLLAVDRLPPSGPAAQPGTNL